MNTLKFKLRISRKTKKCEISPKAMHTCNIKAKGSERKTLKDIFSLSLFNYFPLPVGEGEEKTFPWIHYSWPDFFSERFLFGLQWRRLEKNLVVLERRFKNLTGNKAWKKLIKMIIFACWYSKNCWNRHETISGVSVSRSGLIYRETISFVKTLNHCWMFDSFRVSCQLRNSVNKRTKISINFLNTWRWI